MLKVLGLDGLFIAMLIVAIVVTGIMQDDAPEMLVQVKHYVSVAR